MEERLGGIYALGRIARESEKDHGPIMEVLTAYVRAYAPWPPPKDFAAVKEKRPWARERPSKPIVDILDLNVIPKPDADIQAILTVIGRPSRILGKGELQKLDLTDTDLRQADLIEANLEGVIFNSSHLEGAKLKKAHLEGANFWYAHLERTSLDGAHMERAFLMEALLNGALLSGTHLEGARLDGAHLKGAFLDRAILEGAFLNRAHLDGAFLTEAHLEGAMFLWADFREARNLTKDQVIQAKSWPLAFFDASLLKELGLPPDHNERLGWNNLSGYNLEGYDLRMAPLAKFYLHGAKFKGANLEEAHLEWADLSEATGLTQEQIDKAYCDDKTKLPPGLKCSSKKKPQP